MCTKNEKCTNQPGGYSCQCELGYRRNNRGTCRGVASFSVNLKSLINSADHACCLCITMCYIRQCCCCLQISMSVLRVHTNVNTNVLTQMGHIIVSVLMAMK